MPNGADPHVQRIFLVEDSPVIRDSLIDALDDIDCGRRVVGTADSENEALERIAESDADVAIIDINLREGSGIGVLSRLALLQEAPSVRIVYTNHYSKRVLEQCERLGATHVLSKGGDLKELLGVLASEH